MMKLPTLNFAARSKVRNTKQKIKNGPENCMHWPRSSDLLLNFWTPIISGLAEATNVKFCRRIEVQGTKQRTKNGQSGRCLRHVTRCCSLEPITIRRPTRLNVNALLTNVTVLEFLLLSMPLTFI